MGSLFNFDFILKEIPQKLLPFDYDAFRQSDCNLHVGATDCNTGEVIWFPKETMGDDFEPLRASSSLPFLAPVVKINGRELMDGGLADPIPVEKALADGYERNVIVLTRNPGYYSTENYPIWLLKLWYAKYPQLIEIIRTRAENYNRQLALAEQLERAGKAVVIRPLEPLTIGRLDRKPQELLKTARPWYSMRFSFDREYSPFGRKIKEPTLCVFCTLLIGILAAFSTACT